MRRQASVHASTGWTAASQQHYLGKQPTFIEAAILKIISFSHHQAVVYTWEFEADTLPDANLLRIREETLMGAGNLFSGSWNSASVPNLHKN